MEAVLQHVEASADTDVPERSLCSIASAAEQMASRLFPGRTVALLITGDRRIRALNASFRQVDQATDVLSFPNGGQGAQVGDLALCWPAVLRQASQNGNTPEAEACALVAHGMLHLAGYDHETDQADALMNIRTVELCGLTGYEVSRFGH